LTDDEYEALENENTNANADNDVYRNFLFENMESNNLRSVRAKIRNSEAIIADEQYPIL
jgi:hypothetical protein